MSDFLFVAVQAYGDNVVSLRMLSEVPRETNIRILGTQLTREVADALSFDRFPVTLLPKGLFAIYNVGEDGLLNATRDFFGLRRALRSHIGPRTTVVFENQRRPGTHQLLRLASGGFRYEQPVSGLSAYRDRREMFERVFETSIRLPQARRPLSNPRQVLIAPGARKNFRAFPHGTVSDLLAYFTERRTETCLVDADGQYADLGGRATRYLTRESLAAIASRIRASDLVMAPDSLFLHLAYALDRPVIAVVPPVIHRAFYFAPPGLAEGHLTLSFPQATRAGGLFEYLDLTLRP